MKKFLTLFLILIILCPVSIYAKCNSSTRVKGPFGMYSAAKTVGDAKKAVDQKRAVLVCEYSSNKSADVVRLYYHFKATDKFSPADKEDPWEGNWSGKWIFNFNDDGDGWDMIDHASGSYYYGCGNFNDIFKNSQNADDGAISYNYYEGSYTGSENQFTCPKYAFLDTNGKNEICIGDSKKCGGDFDDETRLSLVKDNKSIFNLIDKFVSNTLFSDKNIMDAVFSIENLKTNSLNYLAEKAITDYVDLLYFDTGKFEKPAFISSYINANYNVDKIVNYEGYQNFQNTKFKEIDIALQLGNLTEEEAARLKSQITGFYDLTSEENIKNHEEQKREEAGGELPDGFTTEWVDDFTKTCKNFAPALRILGVLLYIAKILLPIILIVKASLDISATVTSGDAATFNKKIQKIAYSLLGGVAIFFIPTVVNIAFGFISDYSSGITEDAQVCSACLLDPFDLTCTQYADKK